MQVVGIQALLAVSRTLRAVLSAQCQGKGITARVRHLESD